MTPEHERLRAYRDRATDWKNWGPYLSERAWGTVREDYSPDGSAWGYLPHDHARSRAYRWNEDGFLGVCDRGQAICFALALWNERDPILKERAFGLTGPEGNHGEDVKEYYFFLDSTPTHSYMKGLYKYPQAAFPYAKLVEENQRRGKYDYEYELLDTGAFDDDRYFDVFVEYAKATPGDLLIQITAINRGPDPAPLHVLPTLWFSNTWSWDNKPDKPAIHAVAKPHSGGEDCVTLRADHADAGRYWLLCESDPAATPELLFTENETNYARLWPGSQNRSPYVKDAFHEYLIAGKADAVNPLNIGTKAAAHYQMTLGPGESKTIRLRLTADAPPANPLGADFAKTFADRRAEADAFYDVIAGKGLGSDAKLVMRQALAGLLWSKQYYRYDVRRWLKGDHVPPRPPASRWRGRNHDWTHLDVNHVLSMPDTWEYPWFAAWDLAFHTIPFAMVDSDFAKRQLTLLLREWFMHPNGQLPAYEWAFDDVNPPVHAWAALRVYQIERRITGQGDKPFLERVFHKLLLNFTWWVNRKDVSGRNVFQGGFLGMDNVGLFDRSQPLPNGAYLDQADGTAWMAMYCLNLLAIALELARQDVTYEDVATKFLEHFFFIASAMNDRPAATKGYEGVDLWDEADGFYYDVLHRRDGSREFLRVRSMVGLIPLLAVATIEADLLDSLPNFKRRFDWFIQHRPDLVRNAAPVTEAGQLGRRLFAIVNADRLRRILTRVLDETEFLSPYGVRSLSRYHRHCPVVHNIDGTEYRCDYQPAESNTALFGGNSNWRGPIWFPINYLLIESLQKFHHYYGKSFTIECPTGSGEMHTLAEVATELSQRLTRLFLRDEEDRRPIYGGTDKFQTDPHFRDHVLFYEYFHGDNGAGLGASHQTGWTALVAKLIQQSGARDAG